jgi:hypothetical protein
MQRGRVIMRAIGLIDWIPSLLHGMRNRLILAFVQIHPSWIALISTLINQVSPSQSFSSTAAGPIAWMWLHIWAVRVPLAHISDKNVYKKV